MMENRSFDHYLGWMPNADGHQAGVQLPRRGRQAADDRIASRPSTRAAATRTPATAGSPAACSSTTGKVRRLAEGGQRQRRVRARLLREGRPRLHPGRRPRRSTTFDRFFCSLLALDVPEPRVHVGRAVIRQSEQQPAGRSPAASRTRPRCSPRSSGRAGRVRYYFNDLPVGALWGQAGFAAREPRRGVLHRLRDRHAAEPRRSSIRRSRTAAAATACPPTSTRTATCASARPTCRTSCTPSWSRRSGSAARSSSSTTSGAGSSTTCGRRASPTSATARTSTRTTARWASASPRSLLSPYARRGHVDHGDVRLRVDHQVHPLPLRR